MKARTLVRTIIEPDGEGTYGIYAVAEFTFEQADGVRIVGSSLKSPGVWDIGGYVDDVYFEEIAGDELDLLTEMLTALGVPNAAQLMPDTIELEAASA